MIFYKDNNVWHLGFFCDQCGALEEQECHCDSE